MNMQKLPTAIVKGTSVIFQFMLITGLLMLANAPLVFSLAFIPISKEILLTFVLQTVTLLPSFVAIVYALWEKRDTFNELSIVKRFWKSYKKNFKISWLSSLILTASFYIFTFDFLYFEASRDLHFLRFLMLFILLMLFMLLLAASGLIARFHDSILHGFVNAFLLCLHYFMTYAFLALAILLLFFVTKVANWAPIQLIFWPITGWLIAILNKKTIENYLKRSSQ